MVVEEFVDVVMVLLVTEDVFPADPFADTAGGAEDSAEVSFELRFLDDSTVFLLSLLSSLPLITEYDPSVYAGGSSDFLFSDVIDTSDGEESSGKR